MTLYPEDNDYFPRVRNRNEIEEMGKALEEDNPLKYSAQSSSDLPKPLADLRNRYLNQWIGKVAMLRWFQDCSLNTEQLLTSKEFNRQINEYYNEQKFREKNK